MGPYPEPRTVLRAEDTAVTKSLPLKSQHSRRRHTWWVLWRKIKQSKEEKRCWAGEQREYSSLTKGAQRKASYKVAFAQRPEGAKGASHVAVCREGLLGREQ